MLSWSNLLVRRGESLQLLLLPVVVLGLVVVAMLVGFLREGMPDGDFADLTGMGRLDGVLTGDVRRRGIRDLEGLDVGVRVGEEGDGVVGG